MDSSSIAMLIALICLEAGSFFFSASETAFSSCNRIRLLTWAEEGNRRAQRVLDLLDRYDRLISAILIGNNIVNIVASTVGAFFFSRFFPLYGAVLSTVVMTLTILTFAEITPKTLAKQNAEKVAMGVAPAIRFIMMVLRPLCALFDQWHRVLDHFFDHRDDGGITESELITMVSEAESDGGLDQQESRLIRSAIEFSDLEAEEILVPRVDMTAVEDTATVQEVQAVFSETNYSRLPVYHGSIDNVVGILHEKDFLRSGNRGSTEWQKEICPAAYATPSAKISDLLHTLQRQKVHMAIIVDEFGGTEGLVTLEDILEELVGEIWDEHDEVVESFKQQEDGSYLIACSADLNDVFELFDLREECDSATVSGWVIDQLGHVPHVGDTFQYENLEVTVTAIRKMRVLEIRIAVLPVPEEE